ncbi:hypothetical protein NL676_006353 [Syzygium grande]|nr:hypothetical protein NL676_006353 [Syzygium grande]
MHANSNITHGSSGYDRIEGDEQMTASRSQRLDAQILSGIFALRIRARQPRVNGDDGRCGSWTGLTFHKIPASLAFLTPKLQCLVGQ